MHSALTVPAFVLGLGENGYGVARSLARAGVQVIGFHGEAKEFARFSRYVRPMFLGADLDDEHICDRLIDCARRTGTRPALFPTSDRFAFLLAAQRPRLQDHFLFHWNAPETLAAVADKALAARTSERAGVPFPTTEATIPGEDPALLAARLPFPCLVKPNRSFATPFPARMKNFVAPTPQALEAFFRTYPQSLGATVCQQIIEGGDDDVLQCTVLVRDAGDCVFFCVRKLHQYPPGYGVMCYGRSEEDPRLRRASLALLRTLQYRGLASLEFKHSRQDDRYYFIEMNPRLPWYNVLSTDAGVNLAFLAWLDLAAHQAPAAPRQREAVHWLSLRLDAGWYLRTRRSRRVSLWRWLGCMIRARSHAWFDWRDPRPFLRASVQLLQTAVAQLRRSAQSRQPAANFSSSRKSS
jgi:predicted ATP-grasp superfamily ATP-dependent carboligase